MKTIMLTLLFSGFSILGYAQSKDDKTKTDGKVTIEELPEIVIKNAGKDFSVYIPEKSPDWTIKNLQNQFIAYDLGKDYQGYENYLVTMSMEKGSLAATYDEKGKLVRVVENYKDIQLPGAVIYGVYKAFPGWQIINDKFLYTQEDGNVTQKQYALKIKKNSEVRKLIVSPKGDILQGLN